MDMISIILDISIAFFGLIIAIIQLLRESRESKKDKKEKENLIKEEELAIEIVNELKPLQDVEANTLKAINCVQTFKSTAEKGDIKPELLFRSVDNMRECYLVYCNLLGEKTLERLYKKLVSHEQSFSFSYGFARYIDHFRKLMKSENEIVGHVNQLQSFIKELNDMKIKAEKDGSIPASYINSFYNGNGRFGEFLEEAFLKDADMMIDTHYLVEELKIRFEKQETVRRGDGSMS